MPIQKLRWRNFSGGVWIKGPRENNPAGTLRRAKGCYPLRTGSIRSRSGIHQLSSLAAHSVFKAYGTRIAGATTKLYRDVAGMFTEITAGGGGGEQNGSPLTFVAAPPTGGKQDYVFVAGGGALRKINPALDTITIWGIDPPEGDPPDAALGSTSAKTIDTFDTASNWTCTDIDSDDTKTTNTSKANATGKKIEGTGSLRFRVPKDTTTRVDRTVAVDLSNFSSAGDSGDEDYIELFIACNRPKHVKNVEVVFYVGSGAPADFDDETDTYSREITFTTVKRRRKKKLIGTGDFIRNKDVPQALLDGRVDKVDFSMAEFVSQDKIAVTRRMWTRLTLPKISFTANGAAGESGKTWANVQAVRISVETIKQGASRVWLDRIRMIGGTGMQGDYQYMFTFFNDNTGTRSQPFPKEHDDVADADLFDPVVIRNVERQPVLLGTVDELPAPTDPQVTHLEIWRTVGNGTQFFLDDRVASTSLVPATTYTDRVADYPGMFSGGSDTKFLQPEELPDDNLRPDDTAQDAVGPFAGRMWLTRVTTDGEENRVFYSGIGRLESVSSYVEIGGTNEALQKLVVWNETLFALTTEGLYRLLGTDEPFVFVRVQGAPGTRFPFSVQATDKGIVYQAHDGFRLFDGNLSEPLGDDALAPVLRGGTSDGISSFSGVASVYARGEYMVSSTGTTLAYGMKEGGWRNVGLPCKSIHWEKDTRVLLAAVTSGTTRICSFEGDVNGEVGGLVAETTTDFGGTKLASDFEIETGTPDNADALKDNGVWGTAQRIYIHGQVEAQDLEVSLVLDNEVISAGTVTLLVGEKRQMEIPIQRSGWITGVRVAIPAAVGDGLSKRVEISAIGVDVYVP